MRILIVDDEPTIRELLSLEISETGYDAVTAANGEEAWELWRDDPVHMVITDWMMPGLDGPALIQRIRHASVRRYTYILLLTAKSSKTDIVTGLKAGADDYLTKPFDIQELNARVSIGLRIIKLENRLRRAMRRLNRLASHDSTTGLLNRRAILRQARIEVQRAERSGSSVSLILLDIDHFKEVNDEHGHLAGDKALREVARLIKQSTRPYDMVGRWGGEEFLLVLPDTTVEQARDVAERVRAEIGETAIVLAPDKELHLSASLGVAQTGDQDTDTLEAIIHRADTALYRAKATGRDRVLVVGKDANVS